MDLAPSRYPFLIHICPDRFGFSNSCYYADFCSFMSSIHSLSEPASYKEAFLDPLWQQAMEEELYTLHKTGTWEYQS